MSKVSEEAKQRRRERMAAKRAAARNSAPDAIICPLCVKQIEEKGESECGLKVPYKGRSLVTHFAKDHHTNALGVDYILGLAPGTTQVCSKELIEKTFKPAGARGAAALAAKIANEGEPVDTEELEDEILDEVTLDDEDF